MSTITIEVSDAFRVLCEKQCRSMAATARIVLDVYTGSESVRKAVVECYETSVTASVRLQAEETAAAKCVHCHGHGCATCGWRRSA